MKRMFRILCFSALAVSLFLALGIGPGSAAPRPAPMVVWQVSSSKVLGDTDLLVYNGDVQVDEKDSSGNPVILDLNGKTVTINGSLSLLGTLDVHDGSLTVTGSVTIQGGLLKMTESSADGLGQVVVRGTFTTDGRDHTGALTAGKLEVRGDFVQYADYSSKAFCPSGTFRTRLSGVGKTVWFETPKDSWLYNCDFTGTTFKSISIVSMSVNLAADKDLTTPIAYPNLYVRGALNGKTLTVPDGTVVSGPLSFGSGRLNAKGDLEVGPGGGLIMTNAQDYMYVDGNFVTKGQCDCRLGTMEIDGNFTQFGLVAGFRDDSYVGRPAHLTKITGANRSVHFDTPSSSYFGKLDTSGATLTADSVVSLNCDLDKDTIWDYPEVTYGGSLNGHSLTVKNNL